ncbi:MAG: putative basic amino acid antiporter YfcC [Pseudomonadota bacterium]|nr:putative basic amino acid antiporter YfcC [Pseudomonadota bacterium]
MKTSSEQELQKAATPSGQTRMPDTLLILVCIAMLAWAATWVVPEGRFVPDADGNLSLETFEAGAINPAMLFASGGENTGFLNLLFDGLVSGGPYSATVGLMAFLLIVGGAFGIIMQTGAMEAGLRALMKGREGKADWLPPLLFVLFSLGGAIFGMSEEAIVFVMILAPAMVRAGYDAITALIAVYVGTQVGFATSWMNPFSVVVAQGIADVPAMSGAGLRIASWVFFTGIGAAFCWHHASRIRRRPDRSPSFESDHFFREGRDSSSPAGAFGFGHALILLAVLAGVVWIAWGVSMHQYYFPEISAQFLTIGIVCALIARLFSLGTMDFNASARAFQNGAMQLVPAALVVGFAKGIVILLGGDSAGEFSVLNSALAAIASATAGLGESLSAVAMLVIQSVINLFVVSGSGQAALTMPLMAPLADLNGVSRQTAVLAFQFGDGLTNLVCPASAALLGCLTAARVSWASWVSFIWKFLVLLFVMAIAVMLLAVGVGYA